MAIQESLGLSADSAMGGSDEPDARSDLDPSVPLTELEERQASVDAVMAAAIEAFERAAFLDPTATLCPGDICRPYDDGGWNYYDPDHLNGRGAALLVPEITTALEGLLP